LTLQLNRLRKWIRRRAPFLVRMFRLIKLRYYRLQNRLRPSIVRIDGCVLDIGNDAGMKRNYASKQYLDSFKNVVARHVCPGSIVLDIGAHVGVTTALLAVAAGEKGKVYAIEPYVESVRVLRQNLDRNRIRNVEVWPVAVSSDSQIRKLYINKDHTGFNSLSLENAQEFFTDVVHLSASEVVTISLDDLIARENIDPDFVKIDCQGAELEILKGGSIWFRRYRSKPAFIYTEFWPKAIERLSGSPAVFFFQFLKEHGIELIAAEDCDDSLSKSALSCWEQSEFVTRISNLPKAYTNLLLKA
jgi:FkbM family methyltransferase